MDWSVLLDYGGIGILAIGLLIAVRILFNQVSKNTQRETERADRNEKALQDLNEKMGSQMIGTLTQVVIALQETNRLLPELQTELRLGRRKDG